MILKVRRNNRITSYNVCYTKLLRDCDCDNNPAAPELDDIGILASLDPVALDKACVDLIYAADPRKSASLRHAVIYACQARATIGDGEELDLFEELDLNALFGFMAI